MKASLNRIFRIIWSETLGSWVAVSEITKARGKRSVSGFVRAPSSGDPHAEISSPHRVRLKPILFALAGILSFNVQANPVGSAVVNGQASFNTSGNTLVITNTPGTIINWQGFSIGANEATIFAQQSAASTVLNRVVTSSPSSILGTLKSNGRVFLVNPNGIVFGKGATVDVAGLVATTLNLSDADFLAGRNNFAQVPGAQNISNAGNLNAQNGGEIYLIAPGVENNGIITALNGEILLVAGNSVELVNSNDPNLRVSITAPAGDATNLGKLIVESGSLGLFGSMVRNSGTASADSAIMQGGRIVFKASRLAEVGGTVSANGTSGGSVNISATNSPDPNAPGLVIQTGVVQAQGTSGAGGAVSMNADNILSAEAINVDGTSSGGQINVQATNRALSTSSAQYSANSSQGSGGDILVSANVSNYTSGTYTVTGTAGGNIAFAGNEIKLAGAQLDASGTNGGGSIHIGGLMHGAAGFSAQGIALANASNVLSNSSTNIQADAKQTGNGGEVVLWSDQSMSFKGSISAKGGAFAGNGGMAEISGLTALGYGGLTDLSATHGLNGTLLLDPRNITIIPGAGVLTNVSGLSVFELIDPNPGAGFGFGGKMIELGNGNIVIASPNDGFAAAAAGAVFMYSPAGTLLSTLTGTTANDQVGSGGIKTVGATNNNFVVVSPLWDSTVGPVADVGAVTWVNGATGLTGSVSSVNSLVGSTASDQVGSGNYGTDGITVLGNGNYVVASPQWNNGAATWAGAVTWGNGAAGTAGAVTSANSLVGSLAFDTVGGGNILGSYGNGVVTALSNGNYVVTSPMWGGTTGNGNGAATWGDGSTAGTRLVGTITLANSLVGIGTTDSVGNGGVTALTNGNYVVSSNVYSSYAFQGGAVTWGNGAGGTVGNVTNLNSLVGGVSNLVGKTITALINGNYVVASPYWNGNLGAVTWGDGATTGTRLVGAVSAANSLVGSTASDYVGGGNTYIGGVTALSNGNYVVGSPTWRNGAMTWAGAVTWGDGATTGIRLVGPVSAANSVVGTATNSLLGNSGTVTALVGNGNYVIAYQYWNGNRGASVWMNGTTGKASDGTYVVSAANSLTGLNVGDYVGMRNTALSNGNYVVTSPYWNNAGAAYAGAATWADGTTGVVGNVTVANSLVGAQVNDYVGSGGVTALSNGNYVVNSYQWNNGTATSAGAVTWGNGATAGTRLVGAVSTANSLAGSTASDQVGATGIIELGNGNYAVSSYLWNNGAATAAGAVTWANSLGSTVGVVSATNSLVGSTANENLGFVVTRLNGATNLGSAYVGSSLAVNGALAGAGRAFILGPPVAAGGALFANTPSTDVTIGGGNIAATLNLGTNVVLQANNDITQQAGAGITATGAGNLTLQAGRSLILNDVINIAGALNLTANDAGAVPANRAAGAAVLDTRLSTITASQINLGNSGGNILAGSMTATTGAILLTASNNITLNTGAVFNAFTTATLVSTGGNFINNSGSATPITATGQIKIYSSSPVLDTLSGMVSNYHLYNCTYAGGCLTAGTVIPALHFGSYYTLAPTLTITANASGKIIGTTDPALTYSVTGLVGGDTAANVLSGNLLRAPGETLGGYSISQGTVAVSPIGYAVAFNAGNFTIMPIPVPVAAPMITSNMLNTFTNISVSAPMGMAFNSPQATPLVLVASGGNISTGMIGLVEGAIVSNPDDRLQNVQPMVGCQ